jgi:hypothetical protein
MFCLSTKSSQISQLSDRDLHRLVLVDTPLAKYFSHAIASSDLDELNIELIRNILYKVRQPKLKRVQSHNFHSNICKTLWNFVRILMTKHECS